MEIRNKNKHRHRSNSAVEGWNYKLNRIMGKQQPYTVVPVQKLKEGAQLESLQLKTNLESGGQKRKKAYVKTRELKELRNGRMVCTNVSKRVIVMLCDKDSIFFVYFYLSGSVCHHITLSGSVCHHITLI